MFPLDMSLITLPLDTNVSHTEFPRVYHLSHLHLQPSYMPGAQQFLPAFSAAPCHTVLEGKQALKGGHWSTPLVSGKFVQLRAEILARPLGETG